MSAAHQAPSRGLHELVTEAAALVNCGVCWARGGVPCTVSGPPAYHLARFMRAERKGLLSRAELESVVITLDVVAPGALLHDGAR